MSIQVIKPGLCTTVQDAGRHGYQHLGVPVTGPMDMLSHRLANLLVGNRGTCNSLEVTLLGPLLRFDSHCLLAIGGADLGASLDGVPLPPGRAVKVAPGALLAFGARAGGAGVGGGRAEARAGARAYLAIHGGFLVPEVLGSTSTLRRGALGGVQGRELKAGDTLGLTSSFRNAPRLSLPASLQVTPEHWLARPVRIVRGRQWDCFSPAAQHALVHTPYTIGNDSERMGYRLNGAELKLLEPLELLSEAVTFGTLQVPPSGQPIVLMADRQTTGGYPKIAHVASVDLPLLAQRLPGDSVRFELIDLAAAQALAVERAQLLRGLEDCHA